MKTLAYNETFKVKIDIDKDDAMAIKKELERQNLVIVSEEENESPLMVTLVITVHGFNHIEKIFSIINQ